MDRKGEAEILAVVQGLVAECEGRRAYLVGGCVRDRLLGRESPDLDLAVSQGAVELAREAANRLGGAFFLLDAERQVARVVLKEQGLTLDFAALRGDDIQADLALRDFTIDALALELGREEALLDPYGGERDLRQKLLRPVSERIFQDDPLRMLRAVRIGAELGFALEPRLEKMIGRERASLQRVSWERIRDEIAKILALEGVAKSIGHLDSLGLLKVVIPELDGPDFAQLEALEQVLDLEGRMRFLPALSVEVQSRMQSHLEEPISGGRARLVLLKLAALLGRLEGAAAASILRRLRFSGDEVILVAKALRHRARPGHLARRPIADLEIYRFFRDTEGAGLEVLLLSFALSEAPQETVQLLVGKYYEAREVISPPVLVDGHDLVATLGLSPGPRVGELLERVREAYVEGRVRNKEEALQFLRETAGL